MMAGRLLDALTSGLKMVITASGNLHVKARLYEQAQWVQSYKNRQNRNQQSEGGSNCRWYLLRHADGDVVLLQDASQFYREVGNQQRREDTGTAKVIQWQSPAFFRCSNQQE